MLESIPATCGMMKLSDWHAYLRPRSLVHYRDRFLSNSSTIDAPEKAQPFGQRSRESLEDLVAGRNVIVETFKKDRYGRYVGKVVLNSRDVNLEKIRSGMAWFYRQYAHEQSTADRQRYDQAEKDASGSHVGLSIDSAPTAPWDYRRSGR